MTIQQALTDRVRFVRLPEWEPGAHIELHLLPDGLHGPWAHVRDISGDTSVYIGALIADPEDRYVPFIDRRHHPRIAHEIDGCNPASCPDCADERAQRGKG